MLRKYEVSIVNQASRLNITGETPVPRCLLPMLMKSTLALLFSVLLVASVSAEPNIVVILTDDQGYADFSFNPHHPKEVDTPHMDALAREGVFFSQAYTSGNVCSPTRAGLMLGRYQQRAGVYDAGTGGSGFDPKIPIFPAFLPDTYISSALGKWHLGLDNDFPKLKWHPLSRGFDSFYGFMGRGAHDYYNLRSDAEGKFMHPIYRDKQRIHDKGYLTTRLTEEAVEFIHKRHEKPFFLYLAYNAVHAPAQAPDVDIKKYRSKYPHLSERRAILMAMLEHLDDGVGEVVKTLKETDTFDDTLLFFLTDNGGAGAMEANNAPLRGRKSQVYEGGHRTPFIVSWPDRFKGGRTIKTPIISLDVLPTALDAIGQLKPDNTFDGKSLLPLIEGKSKTHHDHLFWSEGGSTGEWAVRSGDFKLIGLKDKRELYNLADDPAEATNLVAEHPAKATEMEVLYRDWLDQMAPPANGQPKRWDKPQSDRKPESKKRTKREAKRSNKNKTETGLIDFSNDRSIADHRPIIIAHRGGVISAKSHECSMKAIRLAAAAGYDMVELDIQRSSDGIPMLFHDRTLAKACGKTGKIADYTAGELESIQYLAGDDHIIRLETALKRCRRLGLGVMLDLKAGRDSPEFLKEIDLLIVKHQLGNATNSISGTEMARKVLKHVRFTPTNEEMDRLRNTGIP